MHGQTLISSTHRNIIKLLEFKEICFLCCAHSYRRFFHIVSSTVRIRLVYYIVDLYVCCRLCFPLRKLSERYEWLFGIQIGRQETQKAMIKK